MNKARLECFSDGVFGITITLLELGVQVPTLRAVSDAELRNALIQALSLLVPYVTKKSPCMPKLSRLQGENR